MTRLKFFCINLASRKDRWRECEKEFLKQGLKVDRWNAKPRPENRRFGAGLSHREIIEYAKKNNWEYVAVFEDDVKFLTNDFKKKCLFALTELTKTDWYILYFGGLIGKGGTLKTEPGLKSIFRIKKVFEAHAVIYNKKFFDLYLEKHPNKYSNQIGEYYLDNTYNAFDQWYANYVQEKYPCYITKKILVSQRDDFSDIEEAPVWRKSRAEIIFILYKWHLGLLVETWGKYIKFLIKNINVILRYFY